MGFQACRLPARKRSKPSKLLKSYPNRHAKATAKASYGLSRLPFASPETLQILQKLPQQKYQMALVQHQPEVGSLWIDDGDGDDDDDDDDDDDEDDHDDDDEDDHDDDDEDDDDDDDGDDDDTRDEDYTSFSNNINMTWSMIIYPFFYTPIHLFICLCLSLSLPLSLYLSTNQSINQSIYLSMSLSLSLSLSLYLRGTPNKGGSAAPGR